MRTRRILGATALTTLVAVSLAGCVKMDMQLDLQSDDTVDGSMVFAVSSALAEMTGQDPATIAEQMSADTLDMDQGTITSQKPYDDGEYVGSEITFEGETLDSFAGTTGEELSIVREGDEFVVSGTMDLSEEALGAGEGGDMMAGLMEGFDVQISITFPGKVSEHNGELDGNTVTWTPQYGEATEISARGSAIEGGGGSSLPLPLLIGVGAAVLVAAALIIFLVMRSRKNAAAAQPAMAGYAPTGYAPPAQGYAPAPMATPPAAPAPPAAAPPVAPAPPAAAPPVAPPAPPADGPAAPPEQQTPPPPPA